MAPRFPRIRNRVGRLGSTANHLLWHTDPGSLAAWQGAAIRAARIAAAVLRDLLQGQLSLRATSLVFTTLVGFFPLLALVFTVLKSLGVHNALEPTLLTLLQPLGERGAELTTEVLTWVDDLRVDLIGLTSVVLLLWLVLDMMRKIESAFNHIWAVERPRSWSSRLTDYLFAVIVSPLLLFLSISITSWVNTNFFERFLENLAWGVVLIEASAFIAPLLLMSLAFAFAYVFLPNTRVRFSSALLGGFLTTLVWKLMGSVFQDFFLASARESVYLAFATVIVVLFFIYIGWLVALTGSSIAFYHQNPARTRWGREPPRLSIGQRERLCMAVAAAIIRRFSDGREALTQEQLAATLGADVASVETAVQALVAIGLINHTDHSPSRLLPARAVQNCTLVDIWQALRNHTTGDSPESPALGEIGEFQSELDRIIQRELGSRRFVDQPGPSA